MTSATQGHTVTRRFRHWEESRRWRFDVEYYGGWLIGVGYRRGLAGILRGRYVVTMIVTED